MKLHYVWGMFFFKKIVNNMKNASFYGYSYNFSVAYDSIDANDVLDIHKYLMTKHNIK